MSRIHPARHQAATVVKGVSGLEKSRPELVPMLAKRLRRVVNHRLLERILRQTEEEAGID